MMKDLNLRTETIKLLEDNIQGKGYDIGLGNNFRELTPKTKAIKENKNKWKDIKE